MSNTQEKIVLFGAGNYGIKALKEAGNNKIFGFGDTNKKLIGVQILGKRVYSVEELIILKSEIKIYIAVGRQSYDEVLSLLTNAGLSDNIISSLCKASLKLQKKACIGVNSKFKGKNLLAYNSYISNVKMGYASYIGAYSIIQNAKIGHYTSIGPNVHIVQGQHPSNTFVSTHPAFYSPNNNLGISYTDVLLFKEYQYVDKSYSVIIGNDVWIGDGVLIMEGVTIADGTIVAAGALVTKDTLPYSIVGGVPARVIKYRFNIDDINYLVNLKWWNKGKKWIKQNSKNFNDITNLKEKLSGVEWS